MADRTKLTIKVLVLIIVLLVLVVAYAFAVRPAISGYVTKVYQQGQMQGYTDIMSNILVQLQQTGGYVPQLQQAGYAQFPVGNDTLVLQGLVVPTQTTPAQ